MAVDPYRFTGPKVEELAGLTPAQQDAKIEAARSEWQRTRPVEMARQDARRAHVASGGDGATFDAQWSASGEAEHIQTTAKQRQESARRESSIF